MEVFTVRKDRRSGVTDEIIPGPTHIVWEHNQTWCGRKITGISTWKWHTMESVTCRDCIRRRAAKTPKAWRRR